MELSPDDKFDILMEVVAKVVEWKLPRVYDKYLKRLVPYGYAYGSNGERDYFRRMAQEAIEKINGVPVQKEDK